MPKIRLEQIHNATIKALRNWHNASNDLDVPFGNYQSFKHKQIELSGNRKRIGSGIAQAKILDEGIEKLHAQDKLGAEILNMRFSKGEKILKVGHVLNLSADQVSRRQSKAILSLSKILLSAPLPILEVSIRLWTCMVSKS